MFLIDSNVISEIRKGKTALPGVQTFFKRAAETPADLYLSVITIDKQIAATALIHDLTLVTRNTQDFIGTGARLVDPFSPPGRARAAPRPTPSS